MWMFPLQSIDLFVNIKRSSNTSGNSEREEREMIERERGERERERREEEEEEEWGWVVGEGKFALSLLHICNFNSLALIRIPHFAESPIHSAPISSVGTIVSITVIIN